MTFVQYFPKIMAEVMVNFELAIKTPLTNPAWSITGHPLSP